MQVEVKESRRALRRDDRSWRDEPWGPRVMSWCLITDGHARGVIGWREIAAPAVCSEAGPWCRRADRRGKKLTSTSKGVRNFHRTSAMA